MSAQQVTLSKADMLIIRQVHGAYAEFGMPFLLAQKWWKRAARLAERGFLKAGDCKIVPAAPGLDGYLPTTEGIDAYNAAVEAARESGK